MSLSYRDRRRSAPPAESFKFVVCDDYTIRLRLEDVVDSLAFSRDHLEELLLAKGYAPSSIYDNGRWQSACQVYGQAVDKYFAAANEQPEPLSDEEPPTRLPTSRPQTARQTHQFPYDHLPDSHQDRPPPLRPLSPVVPAMATVGATVGPLVEAQGLLCGGRSKQTIGRPQASLSARIAAPLQQRPAPRPLSARLPSSRPPTEKAPAWTLRHPMSHCEAALQQKQNAAEAPQLAALAPQIGLAQVGSALKQQNPLIPKLDLSQISPEEEPDWAAGEVQLDAGPKMSPNDLTLALRSRTLLCEALEEIAEDLQNVTAAVSSDYKDINRHNHKLAHAKEELEQQMDEISRDFDVKLNELECLKAQVKERHRLEALQWRRSSAPPDPDSFGYCEGTDEGHLQVGRTGALINRRPLSRQRSPSPKRSSSKRKRTVNRQASIEFRPRRILSVDRGCGSPVRSKLRKLEASKLEIEAEKKWRIPAWLSRKLPF